jgi:hypothetical protein
MVVVYLELSHESLGLGLEANGLGSEVDMMLRDDGPEDKGSCRFPVDVLR